MKLRSMVIVLAGFFLLCLACNAVEAESKEVQKVEAATEVLTELMAIPERASRRSCYRMLTEWLSFRLLSRPA